MNKIQIMESSVRKWNRIIAENGADGGVIDCPPCRIFYMLVCIGCPIAEYSGKKFCKDTPYVRWYWHQTNEHGKMRKKVYCSECLQIATEMRDFMAEIVDYLKSKESAESEDEP